MINNRPDQTSKKGDQGNGTNVDQLRNPEARKCGEQIEIKVIQKDAHPSSYQTSSKGIPKIGILRRINFLGNHLLVVLLARN